MEVLNGDEGPKEEEPNQCWPFLLTLDQFNLMDSDIDPSLIQVLEDLRYALSLFVSLSLRLSLSLSLSLSPFLSHYLIMAGQTCVLSMTACNIKLISFVYLMMAFPSHQLSVHVQE